MRVNKGFTSPAEKHSAIATNAGKTSASRCCRTLTWCRGCCNGYQHQNLGGRFDRKTVDCCKQFAGGLNKRWCVGLGGAFQRNSLEIWFRFQFVTVVLPLKGENKTSPFFSRCMDDISSLYLRLFRVGFGRYYSVNKLIR
jgi:hypothetical protein